MEETYLEVIVASLQDQDSGIKSLASSDFVSKLFSKRNRAFFGHELPTCLALFGLADRKIGVQIGQRLLDSGYILPLDSKTPDPTHGVFKDSDQTYQFADYLVMDRQVITHTLPTALGYFSARLRAKTDGSTEASPPESTIPLAPARWPANLSVAVQGHQEELVQEGSATLAYTVRGQPRGRGAPPTSREPRKIEPGLSESDLTIKKRTAPKWGAPVSSPASDAADVDRGIEEDTDEITFAFVAGDPVPLIKAATLDRLVERLTFESYIDLRFQTAFLATYPVFTTADTLIEKLRVRFAGTPQPTESGPGVFEQWARQRKVVQLRVLAFISRWLQAHIEDWADCPDRLRSALFAFLDVDVANCFGGGMVAQLKGVYASKTQLYAAEMASRVALIEPAAAPPAPFSWADVPIMELAQQMTLYEYGLFSSIPKGEFMGTKWSRKNKEELAPRLLRMIRHFNRVSSWVVCELVTKPPVKQRAAAMSFFISLCLKLRELNNWSSLMAIMAALASSPVRRLKATWAEISPDLLEKYKATEELLSHARSYKNYREALERGRLPCIPYVGLALTDLTFIEDGNPSMLGGLINFSKQAMIARIVLQLHKFQDSPYKGITRNAAAVYWLQNLRTLESEDEAYQISLKVEPRNAMESVETLNREAEVMAEKLTAADVRIAALERENATLREQLATLDASFRSTIVRSGSKDFTADSQRQSLGLVRPLAEVVKPLVSSVQSPIAPPLGSPSSASPRTAPAASSSYSYMGLAVPVSDGPALASPSPAAPSTPPAVRPDKWSSLEVWRWVSAKEYREALLQRGWTYIVGQRLLSLLIDQSILKSLARPEAHPVLLQDIAELARANGLSVQHGAVASEEDIKKRVEAEVRDRLQSEMRLELEQRLQEERRKWEDETRKREQATRSQREQQLKGSTEDADRSGRKPAPAAPLPLSKSAKASGSPAKKAGSPEPNRDARPLSPRPHADTAPTSFAWHRTASTESVAGKAPAPGSSRRGPLLIGMATMRPAVPTLPPAPPAVSPRSGSGSGSGDPPGSNLPPPSEAPPPPPAPDEAPAPEALAQAPAPPLGLKPQTVLWIDYNSDVRPRSSSGLTSSQGDSESVIELLALELPSVGFKVVSSLEELVSWTDQHRSDIARLPAGSVRIIATQPHDPTDGLEPLLQWIRSDSSLAAARVLVYSVRAPPHIAALGSPLTAVTDQLMACLEFARFAP